MSPGDGGGPPEPLAWTAGVDYVRFTYVGQGDELLAVADRYHNLASWAGRLADPDTPVKPWSALGYQGLSYGPAAYGTRADGAMYQVSGAAAHEAFAEGAPHTNISRLDLAVTVWLGDQARDIPRLTRDQAIAGRAGRRGRPVRVTFIDGCGDGDTCYIGSRLSDSYIRVYDKGAEAKEDAYAGSVRYEVELKGPLAAQEAAALDKAGLGIESHCCEVVRSYLADRGLSLPLGLQAAPVDRQRLRPPPTTTVRRLAWLQRQVSPTVRDLIALGIEHERVFTSLFGRAPNAEEQARLDNLVAQLYIKGRTARD